MLIWNEVKVEICYHTFSKNVNTLMIAMFESSNYKMTWSGCYYLAQSLYLLCSIWSSKDSWHKRILLQEHHFQMAAFTWSQSWSIDKVQALLFLASVPGLLSSSASRKIPCMMIFSCLLTYFQKGGKHKCI